MVAVWPMVRWIWVYGGRMAYGTVDNLRGGRWFVLLAFPHVHFLPYNISTECFAPWCFHIIIVHIKNPSLQLLLYKV